MKKTLRREQGRRGALRNGTRPTNVLSDGDVDAVPLRLVEPLVEPLRVPDSDADVEPLTEALELTLRDDDPEPVAVGERAADGATEPVTDA